VSYVQLGKCLRKCRESIVPTYSQHDLAACVHSDPDCQGIFLPSIQGPDDLVPVIEELEAHGQWTLSGPLLKPFLQATVECLAPHCNQKFLVAYVGIIVKTLIDQPPYDTFIDPFLPGGG
jgi:hypothetical protein